MRLTIAAAALAAAIAPAYAADRPLPAPEYGPAGKIGHPALEGEPGAAEAATPAPVDESEMVGRSVLRPDGELVGEVTEPLTGAVVVDRGGSFSVGARRVVMRTDMLRPAPEENYLIADLSPEEVAELPEYVADQLESEQVERRMVVPPASLGAPAPAKVRPEPTPPADGSAPAGTR